MEGLAIKALCLLLVASLAMGQVLNGYINPMWMTDRRGRGRSISGRDFLYQNTDYRYRSDDPRSPTSLVYLDEQGRYRPVYRQDRVFRADQNYYRVNEPEQFLPPVQTNQAPLITTV